MSTAWIVAALSILGGDGPKAAPKATAVAAKDVACCAGASACAQHVAPKARAKSDVEVEITAFEPDPKTIASAVDVASKVFPRLNARELFELAQKFKVVDGKVSIECDLGVAHGKAVVKIVKERAEAPVVGTAMQAVLISDSPGVVKAHERRKGTLSQVAPPAATCKALQTPSPASCQASDVEEWRLSLPDAIRIGLDNSEVVRVISLGVTAVGGHVFEIKTREPITIAPLNWDAGLPNFRLAMMAHVRSVEQQYWALSQQQVQESSRKAAVKMAEEIVCREKAELNDLHGNTADVAEAQQNLENFQLSYITAVSDTITTERQLRNILGLPVVDNRRIVPATAPTEAKVEPDWETSLAAMMANQPDLVAQRQEVERSAKAARASDELANLDPKLIVAGVEPDAMPKVAKAASHQAERQKAFYQQVLHQTTHSLARFTLEIDANYKQFQTARRLRQAAETRLKASRAYYDEGRASFTVDRMLDAINQYANALAQEAQFRASYNTSIVALEEAKGTLLEYDKIAVAAPPKPRSSVAYRGAVDKSVQAASHDAPSQPLPVQSPATVAAPSTAKADGATVTYRVEVKTGPRTVKFEGTITNTPTPAAQSQP